MGPLLTIEKLVHGGLGLARTDHGVVFVADVAPGEKVRVVGDGAIGGQPCARPVKIVEPASCRRAPACEHFGTCGGCDWLHISYDAQLSIKRGIFVECLERIGKIKLNDECEVFSSPEFEYRQRCQFKIEQRNTCAGFYKRKSQCVVNISRCPLLAPQLNSVLQALPRCIASLPPGTLQIKVIAGADGSIASSPVLQGISLGTATLRIGAYSFMVSGDSFFQGNRFVSEKLGTWPLDLLEGGHCVDLYGGVGFFSILLGKRFKHGVLVDNIKAQVELARLNFENNGISHFSVRAQSVEDFLFCAARTPTPVDCMIIDPPRTGMSPRVRNALQKVLPRTILSVSCDPSTHARDIGFFVNTCGYTIVKTAMVDLYPNTHHIETAVVLKRRV
jgi:23S rRNA (uracil1939-C5)-methyltransferase